MLGSALLSEIFEQPAVVAAVVSGLAQTEEAAAASRRAEPRFVLYVGRGTSDHAGVYGKYLASTLAGLPTGLAAPSAAVLYRSGMDLRNCLVIALSQSGETPDVAEFLAYSRLRGALTIAITDKQESTIAQAAETVLRTHSGEERAIPATKSYTSQLATLALFWSIWSNRDDLVGPLDRLPGAMTAVLEREDSIVDLASRYRFADRLLVAARGYNYATALEASLKLREACYLAVDAYSSADLLHGPIAAVENAAPAMLFAYPGPAYQSVIDLVGELETRSVETAIVGPAEAVARSGLGFVIESNLPEPLSPLLTILPAQLLAYHLAVGRGIDPDRPRGLSKVTRT